MTALDWERDLEDDISSESSRILLNTEACIILWVNKKAAGAACASVSFWWRLLMKCQLERGLVTLFLHKSCSCIWDNDMKIKINGREEYTKTRPQTLLV